MKKEEGFGTNLTKFYIIALLHEKPRYGYEIIDEMGKSLGKKPSPGQVYPLLRKLRQKGYVKVAVKSKRKTYYLKPKGRIFSKKMIEHFSSLVKIAIRHHLRKCAHCDCEIYAGAVNSRGRWFCCRNCARSYRR